MVNSEGSSYGLQFLKLGGSLITDKSQPHTPRLDTLARLAEEIARMRNKRPNQKLLLGHGAGSFAHVPASKYGTRQGVHTQQEWRGFAEVWREASLLDNLVLEALHKAGLPAIALHPCAAVTAQDGQVASWDLAPIRAALDGGLLPVVHGDVIFDTIRGGTILSTEDIFNHLARNLEPHRILLAGREAGVWADYPSCTRLIPEITYANLADFSDVLEGSASTDVTGGMSSKVHQMLALTQEIQGLEVIIFSGEKVGMVEQALLGSKIGTLIRACGD